MRKERRKLGADCGTSGVLDERGEGHGLAFRAVFSIVLPESYLQLALVGLEELSAPGELAVDPLPLLRRRLLIENAELLRRPLQLLHCPVAHRSELHKQLGVGLRA